MIRTRKKKGKRTRRQRGGAYHLPKKAWAFWDSETPPKSIAAILKHRPAKMPGWESIQLSQKTIDQYIDPSTYPAGFDALQPQHKADWIRLSLLEQYGGVWLDAGIIINNVAKLDTIYQRMITEKQEAALFFLNHHGYKDSVPLYIDNWFIMAPKASPLIHRWKKEYEVAINLGLVEYKKQHLINTPMTFVMFNEHLGDIYLLCQAVLQKILQQAQPKPRVMYLDPGDNMFKLHATCAGRPNRNPDENSKCVQNMLLTDPIAKKLPYIKLRGPNRENLNMNSYFT